MLLYPDAHVKAPSFDALPFGGRSRVVRMSEARRSGAQAGPDRGVGTVAPGRRHGETARLRKTSPPASAKIAEWPTDRARSNIPGSRPIA